MMASMDAPLHPPLRLKPISSTPVSSKTTEKILEAFIDDFQIRSTASQGGGNTAVTVQLQNLRDAVHEERKELSRKWYVVRLFFLS